MKTTLATACGLIWLLNGTAEAQVVARIDAEHRFAWSENAGYLDFASADGVIGAVGVRVMNGFLVGTVWGENIGWIRVGNPDGGPYANTTGLNYGVNVDPETGHLSGYGWSENTGWINFGGGAMASPAQPARVDLDAWRLRGYAWGENIGWINFDAASAFVGLRCPADLDSSGEVDLGDFLAFFNCYDAESSCAEMDAIPGIDLGDFLTFFNNYDGLC